VRKCWFFVLSQEKKTKEPSYKAEIDSPQWRKEHYVVNRDSAYADPRIAITKLMGGNKRFVRKTIKPRQDMSTIKSLEKGNNLCDNCSCSDSEFLMK
jgi:carbonic anhydrase